MKSYIEELTKLIYDYREMMGNNPHTITLGREAYDRLVKEIKDSIPLYEDEDYKDHKEFIFMGVNIEVCNE